MALPINYDTVQVRGKYVYLDGTPALGQLRFTGKVVAVSDAEDTIIVPSPITATLDSNGQFTVDLPATDDPDIQPNGWTYTVTEDLSNGGGRTYDIDVPLSAKSTGIDLSEVVAIAPVIPSSTYGVISVAGRMGEVTLVKADVGLSNVDNTSDVNKPISTATQAALSAKADSSALTSHTNNMSNPHNMTKDQIDLGYVDNTSDLSKPISIATQTALNAKASSSALSAHTSNTSNPHGTTKAQVGLGNVDNTSDLNKPISTATQAALNGKVNFSEVAAWGHDPSLRKWYSVLAGRYGSIASVVVMGDSIVEGIGSNTFIDRRFQQILQAALRARFQPSIGAVVPYISASPRTIFYPSGYGRAATAGVTEERFGLGRRSAVVPAGESVTFTFFGTRAKLYATKGPTVGKYSIRLNGGVETVVDGVNGSTVSGQMVWDSGALTAGNHSVLVARATSTTLSPGEVHPEGLMAYNGDESAGIRVIDAAKSGSRVSDFTDIAVFDWGGTFSAIEGKGLVLLPWGANDSNVGVSATTFRSDLESLISTCRNTGFSGSFLLIHLPKRGNVAAQAWTDYGTQMKAIADANSDVSFLNLRSRIPDQGTVEAINLDIFADEVHFNEKGQAYMADQLAAAISPH